MGTTENNGRAANDETAGSPKEPQGRRARRRAEIRERLVRSALRLFAQRGFVATTVEEITNLADVGKGTFFNYFPSKEHIFAARAKRQVEKVEQFAVEARTSTEPMNERLYRLAVSLSEGFEGNPIIFHSILVAVCSNEKVRRMLSEGQEQGHRFLAEIMMLGQRRGEVRDDVAPDELATGFQQAFFGTLFVWSLDPSRPLTDCLKETANFLWSAIRKGSE